MASMLEVAASLAVTGATLASTLAMLGGAARVTAAAAELTGELFVERQLEHLVDRSALAAGAGPSLPWPIAAADPDRVVFQSDLDGNRIVETSGSETSALELSASGNDLRLRLRIGRQTMTVMERARTGGRLSLLDRRGNAAGPAAGTLVQLELEGEDGSTRTWAFALPAARSR
jgi:hypothetical protein